MSKKNKILQVSALLMLCTVISKILGFGRELLVAYKFGAGSISDAFVLTNSIPTLIFTSLATAININFIPCYQRIESSGEKSRFTSNLTNISLLIMSAGCLLVELFPRIVLKFFASGLPDETERISVLMLRIVIFSIYPIILAYLYQAYMQANSFYIGTALYGVVTNIVVILFTFISTAEHSFLLSVGTVTAHLLGLGMILFGVRLKAPFRYTPCIDVREKHTRNMVILTIPLLIEDLASSMSLIVDRNLASFLDEGTISGLGYAGTIGNIASSMIATAIMTATFPFFSKLLAGGKKEEFSAEFRKYASALCFLLSPVSVFLIFNANDIVALIFRHGQFSDTAAKVVSESMICYAVGVLPMGMQSYFIRGFYAMQDTKTPVKIKVFALVCNIVLNLLSVKLLRHMGIALSTSFSYVISYFLLLHCLKKHGTENTGRITAECAVSLLLSVIPAVILYFSFGRLIVISSLLVRTLFGGLAFTLMYFGLVMLFRRKQLTVVLDLRKNRS